MAQERHRPEVPWRERVVAYGVQLEITGPPWLAREAAVLPPGARPAPAGAPDVRLELRETDGALAILSDCGGVVATAADRAAAAGALGARVRAEVAALAPEHVFVHAGVVAVATGAIVLPGTSFAGKTTLVRALLEAGATYFSDEFAVLDSAGRVHPYAKPLSVRAPHDPTDVREVTAEALGSVPGAAPVALAAVCVTSYRAGARFSPRPLSRGEAALALLSNAIPARERPRHTLSAITAAVREARAWEGQRGEAGAAAAGIIALVTDNR